MLNLLLEYARLQKLSSEPGYKIEPVRWLLSFLPDGRYLGAVRRGDNKSKGDNFLLPRLSQPEMKAGGAGTRHFLCDRLNVLTLYDIEKLKPAEADKLRREHVCFVQQLRQAATALPVLGMIADALADDARLRDINNSLALQEMPAKPLENATFHVDSYEPGVLVESDVWRDWYAAFRETLQKNKSARRMISLAGGGVVIPAKTHPTVTGLRAVGGQQAGDRLASFKQLAFRHYGLEQSENAAVSEEEAAAYRRSIDHLLHDKSVSYAGAKTVYWYSRPLPEDFEPIVDAGLFDAISQSEGTSEGEADDEPDEAEVEAKAAANFDGKARKLLESIRTGKAPEAAGARFHLLTLSANSGRVVVRDIAETDLGTLLEALLQWREDLRVVRVNADPASDPPKLERLLTAALPPKPPGQKYADWIKPVQRLRDLLFREAVGLGGDGVLRTAVSQLLPQWRASISNGEFEVAVTGNTTNALRSIALPRGRLYARVALVKAYLVREGRIMNTIVHKDHPDDAYHYGRLLAVLAHLQRTALGDVGAGVVQRYYPRASTAPADALGPLIRLSNSHLDKINKALANYLQDRIAEIWAAVRDPHPPKTLDTMGQSLFAMGFYQQIAQMNQDRALAAAKKRETGETENNTDRTEGVAND
jgi:CRISPR-associated protein Csd1